MDFDWDDGKAETNLVKHGVSFLEAASVFNNDFSIIFAASDHLVNEVQIISARETTRRERKVYESVR